MTVPTEETKMTVPKNKLGDLVFKHVKLRCEAHWRLVDGAELFLCAMDLKRFKQHQHLRELFNEMAIEIVMNWNNAMDEARTLRHREPLPKRFSAGFGFPTRDAALR
jgi:hypothetical protein